MSLQIWLPMTKDLRNQGIADIEVTNYGATLNDNGKIGKCYSFNTGSYLTIDPTPMKNFNEVSIAFWVKIISWNTNYATIIDAKNGSGYSWHNEIFAVQRYSNTSRLCFNIADGSSSLSGNIGTNDLDLNTWYHVVCTYETGYCKIYQNGELVSTKATNIVPNFATIANCFIGKATEGAYQFNGYLNDMRVYDHALSPMEVKHLSQGLVLHYPLDGNNGTLVNENLLHGSNVIGSGTTIYGWVSNGSATGMEILSDGSLHYKYNISNSKNIPSITTNTVVPCEFSKTYFYSMDLKFDKAITLGLSTPAHFWVGARNSNSITNTSCSGNLTGIQTEYISNHSGTLPANTWVHITTKFTFPAAATSSGYNYPAIRCFVYGSVLTETTTGEVNVWMKNCKVEEGTIATPWCPNPSDALYTALGYDDGIEYDTSGYGNNGTKVGTLSYSTDSPRYLASMVFENDCSQYIHTPYLSFLTDEITMSCWVHQTSASNTEGTNQYIMSQGRDTNGNGFSIRSNNGVPYLYMNTGSGISLSSGMNILNEWHHLVATYDGSNACIYIDGQLKNSKSITGSIDYSMASERFVVGKMSYSYTNPNHYFPFVGKISDARVYATALSAEDIQKLYTVSASIDSNGNAYSAAYVEG